MKYVNGVVAAVVLTCGVALAGAIFIGGPSSIGEFVIASALMIGWIMILPVVILFLAGAILYSLGRLPRFWADLYAFNMGVVLLAIGALDVTPQSAPRLAMALLAGIFIGFLIRNVRDQLLRWICTGLIALICLTFSDLIMSNVFQLGAMLRVGIGAFLISAWTGIVFFRRNNLRPGP